MWDKEAGMIGDGWLGRFQNSMNRVQIPKSTNTHDLIRNKICVFRFVVLQFSKTQNSISNSCIKAVAFWALVGFGELVVC